MPVRAHSPSHRESGLCNLESTSEHRVDVNAPRSRVKHSWEENGSGGGDDKEVEVTTPRCSDRQGQPMSATNTPKTTCSSGRCERQPHRPVAPSSCPTNYETSVCSQRRSDTPLPFRRSTRPSDGGGPIRLRPPPPWAGPCREGDAGSITEPATVDWSSSTRARSLPAAWSFSESKILTTVPTSSSGASSAAAAGRRAVATVDSASSWWVAAQKSKQGTVVSVGSVHAGGHRSQRGSRGHTLRLQQSDAKAQLGGGSPPPPQRTAEEVLCR